MAGPVVKQLFVYFVGDYQDVVFFAQLGQRLEAVQVEHRSRRVVWGAQDQDFGACRYAGLDLVWVQGVTLFGSKRHGHGPASGKADIVGVLGPTRIRNQNFIFSLHVGQ